MNSSTIAISVIIPSYKPNDYLWECLDSLANQTLSKQSYEIIIILNGCNHPYDTLIEQYISRDNCGTRFKYYQTDQGGVSNARNLGIEKAEGEYLAFIDDDDFVSPTYLEELYEHATPNVISLCYPLSFIDGTNDFKPFYITRDYVKYNGLFFPHYTKARRYFSGSVYKLIHRDIIGNRRFNVKFRNGEDSLFMFEISDAIKSVDFTSENAVYYRRVRSGSALFRKKSSFEVWGNCIRMISAYTRILVRHPFKYSYNFYFTRILGAIHGAIEQYQLRKVKTL